jgi:hypothetical protein
MGERARRSFWKLTTYAEMLQKYRGLLGCAVDEYNLSKKLRK